MRSALTIALLMAAAPAFADEAASALAECKAHQQRLEELEATYTPPPPPSSWGVGGMKPERFGQNDIEHERDLMERTCDYARSLREAPRPAKTRPKIMPRFRADEPARPPASTPPVFDERPPVEVVPPRRPPPPAMDGGSAARGRMPEPPPPQSNVGGTKARHPSDEQSPPPQP